MEHVYFLDIETSTINFSENDFFQVTYLSNVLEVSIENFNIEKSTFFRTIEETIEYFKTLEETIVFVHNLDYELTFLLREIENVQALDTKEKHSIFRDKHSPLSIILNELPNITFRDSYALLNKSVKQLGQDYKLDKLDYVYDKLRLPWDTLEQLDYDYNERDNVIVYLAIKDYLKQHKISVENLPLTFTSQVKLSRKEFIQENFGKHEYNKYYFFKDSLLKDFEFFKKCLAVYQGGLTTSNMKYTNKLIKDTVYSIDIKSSYPNQMITHYFPIFDNSTRHYINKNANREFKKHMNTSFYIGEFTFKNIRIKSDDYLLAISKEHILKSVFAGSESTILSECNFFNGKLISATTLNLLMNDVDLEYINLLYDYDSIECFDIYITSKKRQLRESECSFILNSFKLKEESEKGTFDYNLAKTFINSQYGIKVTCPVRSDFYIENNDIEEIAFSDLSREQQEDAYEELFSHGVFSGNIDCFTDGIYITSFAKLQLLKMMIKVIEYGGQVIYADTDSLKFTMKNEEFFKYLERFNKQKVKENLRNIRFRQFRTLVNPTSKIYNKIAKLGIWELEEDSTSKLFKTLGAKKYVYVTLDDKYHSTIAGCNKNNLPLMFEKVQQRYNLSQEETINKCFTIGVQYLEEVAGRTVAYREKRSREECELLRYDNKMIHQYGGITIKKTTYTLGMSNNDKELFNINEDRIVLYKINEKGEIIFND